jgi:putative DNA primase/helicase
MLVLEGVTSLMSNTPEVKNVSAKVKDRALPPCKKCGQPSTTVFRNYCPECAMAIIVRKMDELNGLEVPHLNAGHNDLGNMRRLLLRYADKFRFTQATGWLYWADSHWAVDETGQINEAAQVTVERIAREVVLATGDTEEEIEAIRESIRKWCNASKSAGRLQAMVGMAESNSEVSVRIGDFDTNINLFNCANGTINFTTNDFQPHNPDDLLTNCSAIPLIEGAQCPRWERFILEIMDGDQEMADFLQRAVGYSMTGLTVEHCLFILWGDGSNGKSTLIEVLRHVFGTYSKTSDFNTFVAKKWGVQSGPNSDIAKLRGARFVSAVGGEQGQKLAESLIKQLTGGDTISACFKFKEPFEFKPQLKLWLSTQHKPEIVGTDEGIWRRIRLIPFNVRFPKDTTLLDTLLAEAPGILRWAVNGYAQWRKHGLMEPQAVMNATTEYRAEEDVLLRFIQSDYLELGDKHKCGARDLYEVYQRWAKNNHEDELSERKFADGMKLHGYKKLPRTKNGVQYQGLRTLSQFQEATLGGVDEM